MILSKIRCADCDGTGVGKRIGICGQCHGTGKRRPNVAEMATRETPLSSTVCPCGLRVRGGCDGSCGCD